MKNISKIGVIAPALLAISFIAAIMLISGCDMKNDPPASYETGAGTNVTTDAPESHAPSLSDGNETVNDTEPPEFEDVIISGILYRLYSDHAVVIGKEIYINYITIPEEVRGVPVTDIADGAFDGRTGVRICCETSSDVYDIARDYAASHECVFIEVGSGKLPAHIYPEWVLKLDWRERDRSGDTFEAVDDNAEISRLVGAYISGDAGTYDELMRRVFFRYACAERLANCVDDGESFRCYAYDTAGIDDIMLTDYDRYDLFYSEACQMFRFAYGSIVTYRDLYDYVHLFYTKEGVDQFIEEWISDIEGEAYMKYAGIGYRDVYKNPVFTLEVSAEKITLHERREVWDEEEIDRGQFTGEYTETEFVLECHDGKWRAPYEPMNRINYPDIPAIYNSLYSNKAS